MDAEHKRLSERVSIVVPIHVSGTDVTGQNFVEQGRTLTISRYGATIVLNRTLAPGQQVTISRVESAKAATARVVGQIGGQPPAYIYGMALPRRSVNLWDILFPPLAKSEAAVVRLLLECTTCETREVVYLNELETEVFDANRSLSRSCRRCSGWTLWKQTVHEMPTQRAQGQREAVSEWSPAPGGGPQNRRRHVRIPLKKKGCIRQPGLGEETLPVENVSRGGFSFKSSKGYLEGSRIEVAVPYSAETANIFVPARILWSLELPDGVLNKVRSNVYKDSQRSARTLSHPWFCLSRVPPIPNSTF